MRVGLLTTSFPRRAHDIPGHFVLGFAQALAARGHRVHVLAPEPAEAEYETPLHFDAVQVEWVRYLAPRRLQRTFYGAGVLDNLRRDPRALLGLAPFVGALTLATRERVSQWDALISHWALPCALIAGALRGARPHLAVLHSADVFVLERVPLRRGLATRIADTADALLFSSRDLRRRFLQLLPPLARAEYAARAHVCPMGIDPAPRDAALRTAFRREHALHKFTLLSLGRLIELKGIEHAIDAVAAHPDVELVVCGDGPARAALEAHARRRGVAVRFVGSVFGRDKHAWLCAADAFVLPSIVLPSGRSEGMPQTVLEAMEHGLPVIASDVGGVSDVVRGGENGFLVAPGDAAAIATALAALREPACLEALSRGAEATAALYHWTELTPMIESLLVSERVTPDVR